MTAPPFSRKQREGDPIVVTAELDFSGIKSVRAEFGSQATEMAGKGTHWR